MMGRTRRPAFALSCVVALAGAMCSVPSIGCGGPGGAADADVRADSTPPCTSSVSFAADVQPIFGSHCTAAACHDSSFPAVGLDLTAATSYGDLVGVPSAECRGRTRVVAGSPFESYLYDKVTGMDICGGSAMPKGRAPLSQHDIDTIRTWICTGAANN